jgi:hypothetical protein
MEKEVDVIQKEIIFFLIRLNTISKKFQVKIVSLTRDVVLVFVRKDVREVLGAELRGVAEDFDSGFVVAGKNAHSEAQLAFLRTKLIKLRHFTNEPTMKNVTLLRLK